jgi:hypothetical protein
MATLNGNYYIKFKTDVTLKLYKGDSFRFEDFKANTPIAVEITSDYGDMVNILFYYDEAALEVDKNIFVAKK